ncbi:MAG: glycosyltransferase family 4 protein [Patescibacteria group bacterium]
MKILELVHRFPPSIGGSQHYAFKIGQALAKLGHTVDVATTRSLSPGDSRGIGVGGVSWRNRYPNLQGKSESEGLTIYRFSPSFEAYTYLFTPGLKKWVRANRSNYDIIHAHGYTFLEPQYALVSKGQKPALVLSGHDLTQPHKNPLLSLSLRLHNATLGRRLVDHYDSFIAHTPENVADYRRLGVENGQITVIPSGIDADRFEMALADKPRGRTELLFVGRLVAYKGAQYLIEAMPAILQKLPEAHATIVGEDQGYGAYLRRRVAELNLRTAVTFTGRVDEVELIRYYQDAHFFVFPSINEGFGLVVLQAIMAGCYPILAEAKALKYLLADIGGTPLAMTSVSTIAQQIATIVLASSPRDLSAQVSQMQKKVRADYAWPAIAQKYQSLFEDLLRTTDSKGY